MLIVLLFQNHWLLVGSWFYFLFFI